MLGSTIAKLDAVSAMQHWAVSVHPATDGTPRASAVLCSTHEWRIGICVHCRARSHTKHTAETLRGEKGGGGIDGLRSPVLR